jgi:DNA-directed RNA polymerase subunit M/transcription elongation factor TFIIS
MLRFCTACDYALTLVAEPKTGGLQLRCRHCGAVTPVAADVPLGVVSEATFRNGGASGGGGGDAAFAAWDDPTLPVTLDVGCPACSVAGAASQRGVVYRKTNALQLRFEYCCRACAHTWRSG